VSLFAADTATRPRATGAGLDILMTSGTHCAGALIIVFIEGAAGVRESVLHDHQTGLGELQHSVLAVIAAQP
jgi:hypothetical protein